MRYFIQLSYKGTNYCGWQIQPNGASIQEELNKSLSTLLKEDINVVGAGRTDTGVHAKKMIAHFNCDAFVDESALAFRLNRFISKDIAIQSITQVKEDAHARFDATSRSYEYNISTQKNPFLSDWSWHIEQPLNLEAMNTCAKSLLGEQDFSCFSKSNTQTKTNICNVTFVKWTEENGMYVLHISANRFLRNMVRAIVGTLVEVGLNKLDLEGFLNVIEGKDRRLAGTSAPAKGLFLTEIDYPENIFLNG